MDDMFLQILCIARHYYYCYQLLDTIGLSFMIAQ